MVHIYFYFITKEPRLLGVLGVIRDLIIC
jgi:hypothetical protein